jgi:uncharacterized membrane protein YedE/YeeE
MINLEEAVMNEKDVQQKNSKWIVISSIILAAITIFSIIQELWFLLAVPVGFLFGFFLQKGDLCGASAFSEVLLMKDKSKVFGLWIAIIVGMAGIAVLDLFDLVKLNPKPMIWLNYIIGGIIFGVGIVLAGGCVSGCLYKAGTGNINSMAGIIGIPIGIALVEFGPLHSLFLSAKKSVITNVDGSVITVSSITGIPFWLLALLFLVVTIVISLIRKKRKDTQTPNEAGGGLKGILFKSWKPWVAGIAIGILVIPAYLTSALSGRNYPLGVTHGVLHVQLLATESNLNHVWQKPASPKINTNDEKINVPAKQPGKKVSWWLISLVISLVAGSWVSARTMNKAKLLPKPPGQTIIAFFGGILVGTGAAFATGCVIGNIVSGWALMSVGGVLFGIVVLLANWITTYFYLMGGNRNR